MQGNFSPEIRETVESARAGEIEPAQGMVGYEVDFQNPTHFRIRCPDCEHQRIVDRRPGNAERVCGPCNRLMGVTPLKKRSNGQPNSGAVYPGP